MENPIGLKRFKNVPVRLFTTQTTMTITTTTMTTPAATPPTSAPIFKGSEIYIENRFISVL